MWGSDLAGCGSSDGRTVGLWIGARELGEDEGYAREGALIGEGGRVVRGRVRGDMHHARVLVARYDGAMPNNDECECECWTCGRARLQWLCDVAVMWAEDDAYDASFVTFNRSYVGHYKVGR